MTALAVIAAQNEAGYIDVTLRTLIEDEGIEVVLLDNGSIDGTRERAQTYLGGGLLEIVDVPVTGGFDMFGLLDAKREVFARSKHDWHVHLDADEWPRAKDDVPLSSFLDSVDRAWHVVNFDEFVFIPPIGVDMWATDYRRFATRYYFFELIPRRLMRAWRPSLDQQSLQGGGHFVGAPAEVVFPENQVLRHYVGLSWSHAIGKRANRMRMGAAELGGWGTNRRDLSAAVPIASGRVIRVAEPWDTRQLDTSAPSTLHFWQSDFGAVNADVPPAAPPQ